jgi:excisionase family DNA binding protein
MAVNLKLFTPEDAADMLAVTPRAIREWLRTGKLKGVKVGHLWRIRESDLEDFLEDGEDKKHEAQPEMDEESRSWLDADIEGDFPPYDWGKIDPKNLGNPVRYIPGKGLLIEENS